MLDHSGIDRKERRFDGESRREAPSRGARTLTAILPNGRTLWLRVAPSLAPAAKLRRLADAAEHGARWQRAATRANSERIRRLTERLEDEAEKLAESRVTRAERVRRRLVTRSRQTDRRFAKAAGRFRAQLAAQIKLERETVRRLARRDVWDKIVIATSFPLFAAYGQRGHPFGVNNLALLVSLLIWLVGDEVGDAIFGTEKQSPYPVRDTDAWSYIAPVGNLLAGWWLMSGRQHERFVAGFTRDFALEDEPTPAGAELRHAYVGNVDLSEVVAAGHFEDFRSFADVPAVATVRGARFTAANARIESVVAAANRVNQGVLTIRITVLAPDLGLVPVPPILDELDVAWMVDTQDPELSSQ